MADARPLTQPALPAAEAMTGTVVVWQLCDGKRGHERQVEGLLDALAANVTLSVHRVAVPGRACRRLFDYCLARAPWAAALPDPALLIGAGRACQWPLLAARRARGGRAVYLMRPGLPVAWFDLCIVPRHDAPAARHNVIASEGPLNPVRPAAVRNTDEGLILIGGPSAHHAWDGRAVLAQVASIVARQPHIAWTLADSRRSPPEFAAAARACAGFRFVSHRECPPDWLPAALARVGQAWVSADSVSMLYEALTAGAVVGVIAVPARRRDRITAVADELCARGWVRRMNDLPGAPLTAPVMLNEATRCAEAIIARWPELVPSAVP